MKTHTRLASWERFNQLRKQRRLQNISTLGLVVLGPFLAVITYLGLGPFELDPSSSGIRLILLADLIYAISVAALILHRLARIVAARRKGSAGSELHMRLTAVFAVVAFVPTVLVAVFAVVTLNFGLEGWFSERVRDVVSASLSAAEAYEKEQNDDLTEDAVRLAEFINNTNEPSLILSDTNLRALLSDAQQLIQRGLKEAFVIDGQGMLQARGDRSYLFDFERPTDTEIQQAAQGQVVVIKDWSNNEFRALVKLGSLLDRYLYVSRQVDGEILSLLDETQKSVRLYTQLESQRGRLLFDFGLVYLGFAVILILAAIWLGLWFAERLARPIGRLAHAAERVGDGDLDVQVIEADSDDEVAKLGQVFNQMTRQLKGQRAALLLNTEQVERRRRLFDSVLSSVTAGVIGLDPEGRVAFMNRSALKLLDIEGGPKRATYLADLAPEFNSAFTKLKETGSEAVQDEIRLTRRGQLENLLVQVAIRTSETGDPEGYVVAFDDVTELVGAQKMAAWGDVARRIAHEIKNPLTPIQLSAEQLKRKLAPIAGDQADALEQYTSVIIRQTDDLRRIVDEFSKFARMPEPERREADLMQVLRDAVLLQDSGHPEIDISLETQANVILTEIDQTMISQALINLIKNAGEAIEAYQDKGAHLGHKAKIKIGVTLTDRQVEISVADNGVGLPEDRARLFEPYVTTRDKGTGLGLPIVKKIIEEHGGSLALRAAASFDPSGHQGAEAVITLPRLLVKKQPQKEVA